MSNIIEYRLFISRDTAPDVYQFWQGIPQNDRRTIAIQALRSFMKNYPELIPENTGSDIKSKDALIKKPNNSGSNSVQDKNKSRKGDKSQNSETSPIDDIDEEDFKLMQDLSNSFGSMNIE